MRFLSQYIRQRPLVKALIAINVAVILFNEWVVYWIQSWRWPAIPKPDDDNALTALLVADSQLVGFKAEHWLLGTLTRWDCYRYLAITFSLAFSYVKPDVVIFLGDLIDEGSTSDDEQYVQFVATFNRIYKKADKVQKLYVYGDNDVGGEGTDPKTPLNVKRFYRHFSGMQAETVIKSVRFIDMEMKFSDDEKMLSRKPEVIVPGSSQTTVLLTHQNVLRHGMLFYAPILTALQPKLIISAHVHTPHTIRCSDCGNKSAHLQFEAAGALELDTNFPRRVYEIIVPTCSYRMGVPNMGFGVAVFKSDGVVNYDVLWLPSRYKVLQLYLIPLASVLMLALLHYLRSRCYVDQKFRLYSN